MRVFLFVFFTMLLAGCATEPALKPSSEHDARLARLNAWRLEGRIGVQTGNEGWNANLIWEHEANQEHLQISGPFNQGAVSIFIKEGAIFIDEGNGIVSSSRDPETMLKTRLGFSVPLYNVRFWLMGVPSPEIESSGIENGFSQSGWRVQLQRYMSAGEWIMPQKLLIQGDSVKLKLIIDEWFIKG